MCAGVSARVAWGVCDLGQGTEGVAPCKPALTLGLLTSSPTLKGQCCVTQHAGFPAELLAPGPLHTGVGAQGDEAGRALHSFPSFPTPALESSPNGR